MNKTLYLARRKTVKLDWNIDYLKSYYVIATSPLFSNTTYSGQVDWYNKKNTYIILCPKLFGPILPSQFRLKPGEGPVKIPINHFGEYVIWGE